MVDDPIVKETRKIRDKIASECSYDLHVYFDMLRKEEAKTKTEILKRKPASARKIKTSI